MHSKGKVPSKVILTNRFPNELEITQKLVYFSVYIRGKHLKLQNVRPSL